MRGKPKEENRDGDTRSDMPTIHWFITVSYLETPRGLLCDGDGNGYWQESRHTEDEIRGHLGCMAEVLIPISLPFTASDVERLDSWLSLPEYDHQLGVAAIPPDLLKIVTGRAAQELGICAKADRIIIDESADIIWDDSHVLSG